MFHVKLAFSTAAVAVEDGVELTITAKSYVRDLLCMADKVDAKASVAEDEKLSIIDDWIATGNVDAMLLVNVELGDPCVALLEEHEEMPVLAIADARPTSYSVKLKKSLSD